VTSRYRSGSHWGRTLIQIGKEPADAEGRRPDDRIVGLIDDPALVERICALLNDAARSLEQAGKSDPLCVYPDGVCTCGEPEGHPA